MRLMLLRPAFAFLVSIAYLAATVVAAASALASCPALGTAPHTTHSHHGHGNQHHHGPPIGAGECLKCCLGACLSTPCLPGPTAIVSKLAIVGSPVLYWAVSAAFHGRAVIPEPGPPKPIA